MAAPEGAQWHQRMTNAADALKQRTAERDAHTAQADAADRRVALARRYLDVTRRAHMHGQAGASDVAKAEAALAAALDERDRLGPW